ncbi:MAG: helix-turn-helix domain-containing protein [Acidobacteriota bacterium]|nr:helix-turn-helix domain-containing protein [Acidobacteriota bacterium]
MNGLLTTQEAAIKLGVTAGRVRQMIADGQLPATKMGRDNFIKESDLRLVENRKVGRPPKSADDGKKKTKAREAKERE